MSSLDLWSQHAIKGQIWVVLSREYRAENSELTVRLVPLATLPRRDSR